MPTRGSRTPWTRKLVVLAGLLAACDSGDSAPGPDLSGLRIENLVTGLDTPWDLVWGPDDRIWLSERGGRISRVDPQTGQRTTVGTIAVTERGESGLMGLALHPDFTSNPYVYAMHSYAAASGGILNRLIRVRYEQGTLGTPAVLLDSIPGASIHDGARIVIGPDNLLYVSTGDAGNGSLAQDRGSLAGKILRLTLDGDPAPGNPFGTAVYSYGHRNPQGLVFDPVSGALLATEHGPGDNDEVNRILRGRNYGWPDVHGFCDDDVSSQERTFCQMHDVAEPLAAWTPTIAPSGADVDATDLIPGWKGSLLFTTLKDATLYRLELSPDRTQVTSTERLFVRRFGRLRDVLVGPRGEVYLATSNRDGRGSPGPLDDRILRIAP